MCGSTKIEFHPEACIRVTKTRQLIQYRNKRMKYLLDGLNERESVIASESISCGANTVLAMCLDGTLELTFSTSFKI